MNEDTEVKTVYIDRNRHSNGIGWELHIAYDLRYHLKISGKSLVIYKWYCDI